MLGAVAQSIALTAHGNALFQNPAAVASPVFYPWNSTFRFCEDVRFVDVTIAGNSRQETAWAPDPMAWFDRLAKEGTYALRLHYGAVGASTVGNYHVPERMLSVFVGGGGRWLIEGIGPRGSDCWEARWEIADRSRADGKIWRVTYERVARGQVTQDAGLDDLENLKHRLETTLLEIQGYASAHQLDNFAAIFAESRSQLSAETPGKDVDHSDLTLNGQLGSTAQQVLAASQLSWVFGGMGSWNDTAHDRADREYERLSAELFALLNRAYVAVANATAQMAR
jgi:hypothetical protein